VKFAADENLDNDIIRGIRRLLPGIDLLRIQDTEVFRADDPTVLEWCALEQRILLTHDVRTITKFAYERLSSGLVMPGVFEISKRLPTSVVLADLELIATCSQPEDWDARVWYLPLR
jgi:uncharacterized protein with PIN domain